MNEVKAKRIDSNSEHLVVRQGTDEHASRVIGGGIGKCISSTTVRKDSGTVCG